jgi:predicted DNA-binding transcriptional regulator YafY
MVMRPRSSRSRSDAGDPRIARRQRRVRLICDTLACQALPPQALLDAVNKARARGDQAITRRCLELDLAWIRRTMGQVIEAVPRSQWPGHPPAGHPEARKFLRLVDAEAPIPVPDSFRSVTSLEAAALDAARAMLACPSADGRLGPLADALDGLIRRLALPDGEIEERITVRGLPRQPYDPEVLVTCLRAVRNGQALTGTYRPRHRAPHPMTIQPVRLVLVDGEPSLWAWDAEDRIVKRYMLSRMDGIASTRRLDDVPLDVRSEVRRRIASDFKGHGSGAPRRVTLRVLPAAVGLVEGRTLGQRQTCERLPDGSLRISIISLGAYRRSPDAGNPHSMPPVAAWVLSMAPEVIIEEPADLRDAVDKAAATIVARNSR